jgi:general secretion pathway protein I
MRHAARADDGFTLVEVLVAFVILALALSGVYAGLGNSAGTLREMRLRNATAAESQAHLDRLVAGPLAAGETTGRYSNGVAWQVSVTPLHRSSTRTEPALSPARVSLTARDHSGRPLVSLDTIAMIVSSP